MTDAQLACCAVAAVILMVAIHYIIILCVDIGLFDRKWRP